MVAGMEVNSAIQRSPRHDVPRDDRGFVMTVLF
jgi:hypothetical protein